MKSNRVFFVRALLAACGIVAAGCDSKSTPPTATNPPITVTVNPCSPSGTVTLAVATTARVDCSAGGTSVTLAGGGASYLIVPQFPTEQANLQYIGYQLFTGTVATASASVSMSRLASARNILSAAGSAAITRPKGRKMLAQFTMEKTRRTRATRRSHGSALSASRALQPSALRNATVNPPPTVGSLRSFHVASSLTGDSYATVGARVAYVGANVIVYIDTLAPAGGFTPAQLSAFGLLFDQTLYPIDTTAFGSPTDLDNNGHVIMLMSPTVNAQVTTAECTSEGYVAGFFDPGDFDGSSDANSNQGEVFYSIVPDPNGLVSCSHTVTDVGTDVPATFMHELQHLINYSQHVVVSGSDPFSSWMDEGMSIVAEELGSVYYEQKCPYPQASCRTGSAGQFFPDSSQGFVGGFLYDSYEYAFLPDTATITLSNDSENGFSWRGGAWLFTRWFSDQVGSTALRQLERGPSDAFTAVQQIMGQTFQTAFFNFGLALYTDSLPGLARTTAPAINRFVTRNVKQLWAREYAADGPASDVPTPTPLQLFPITNDTTTSVLLPGTMTFFRLDTPTTSATVTIQFSQPGGLAFPPVLAPQMAIFRLPPGQ